MGVTYKIKQDVVDFILSEKKADPSLSCRALADKASFAFNKIFSKSSVNTILKNSALSSPVGRRGKKAKTPESFKIPEERKKQLFENLSAVLLGQEEAPRRVSQAPAAQAPTVIPAASAMPPVKPRPAPKENTIDGLGHFILKAAEWEISREPILSAVLQKYTDCPLSKEMDALSDFLLLMPCFSSPGLPRADSDDLPQALLKICGLEKPPEPAKVSQAMACIEHAALKEFDVALDHRQIMTAVSFFRICLENSQNLLIDTRNNTVWTNNNVQSISCVPLYRAIDILSKQIVVNSEPLILQNVGEESSLQGFLELVQAFENPRPRGIKAVELLDDERAVLSSFANLVKKKRHLIAGLTAGHPEFLSFLDGAKGDIQEAYSPKLKQIFFYRTLECAVDLPGQGPDALKARLGGVVLYNDTKTREERLLLTNDSRLLALPQEIIFRYMERWPYRQRGQEDLRQRLAGSQGSCRACFPTEGQGGSLSGPVLSDPFAPRLIHRFLEGLVCHVCRQHLSPALGFPERRPLLERFLALPGAIEEDKASLSVKLRLVEGLTQDQREELGFCLRSLTQSDIRSPRGQKVFFSYA